jgi:hypothetical protein
LLRVASEQQLIHTTTMAVRKTQRNVKRLPGGRQAIVNTYNSRAWYELADWLEEFVVDYAGWAVLALVVLLIPVALLAIVLGAHSLPLEYLGIPALSSFADSDNGFGLTGAVLLVEFVLLAISVRPLLQHRTLGWKLVILAALVHFGGSLVLQHAVSGGFIVVLVVYLYYQVRGQLT